jgi:hypothetical protein
MIYHSRPLLGCVPPIAQAVWSYHGASYKIVILNAVEIPESRIILTLALGAAIRLFGPFHPRFFCDEKHA